MQLHFFFSAASAQSTRLASIYSNDEYEFTLFGYDDQGRFNRVERHDYNGSIYYDSLVFNDKSQIEVDYAFRIATTMRVISSWRSAPTAMIRMAT